MANPGKAKILARFFKTGRGQYGEGDVFLGVMVPAQRRIAKKYAALPRKDIETLLASRVHEHRLIALFILVDQYQKADEQGKKKLVDFHLLHTARINNWDLIEERFLEKQADVMPRTMLRYAIERFDTTRRSYWLAKKRV